MSEQQQAHPNTTESELIAVRRDKLAKIRELGIDPYGARFDATTTPAELKADFQEDRQVAVAGRLLAIRDMGKSQFFVIGDVRGKIQGFLHRNEVDETTWNLWKLLDRGDWIGITGTTFLTRTGEPTVKVLRPGHPFQEPAPPAGQMARIGGQGSYLPQAASGPHLQ